MHVKKMLAAGLVVLAVQVVQAAYQAYDVKLSLTTTEEVSLALPFPLSQYFPSPVFRAKVKEKLDGIIVCWGGDNLRNPSFVYMKSSRTGKTYTSLSGLDLYWDAFGRLSPQNSTVEGAFDLWLDEDGGDFYSLVGAGMGKVKRFKYSRWGRSGSYSVMGINSFKGQIAGYKSTWSPCGATLDGYDSLGGNRTAVFGTLNIKFNKKYSNALYQLSTASYGSKGGAVPCSDGESEDDGAELSSDEIARALGL